MVRKMEYLHNAELFIIFSNEGHFKAVQRVKGQSVLLVILIHQYFSKIANRLEPRAGPI